MSDIATLRQRINENYTRYLSDKTVEEALFHDLSRYLNHALLPIIKNPERTILEPEQQLAQIEVLKLALDLFLTMDKPPYRLVSSGDSDAGRGHGKTTTATYCL